jgi:GNAT superfamily N-acetyltransferase
MSSLSIKRTSTSNPHFQLLIKALDHELWVELKEDQATYDQFNKVPDIETAVLVYDGPEAIASGCFKEVDPNTVEIKRMFVQKNWRGKGISKIILRELEAWAKEKKFQFAILETSVHFKTARKLYESSGYEIIPNYGPYAGLEESVCMKKEL